MPVFIAYQRCDRALALAVSRRLRERHGIETFVDVLDPDLANGAADVTAAILAGLARCSHLLAVLSTTSCRSWWVPFEIGVATHARRRIASVAGPDLSRADLPEYLTSWPILRRPSDLD